MLIKHNLACLIYLFLIVINIIEISPKELLPPIARFLRSSSSYSERSTELRNILDEFRINANTIIRTQDSRALGANYINETELPSNERCLLLCWETPKCNVAVFEDKEDHKSCYLFDCGDPNNFRCMFTTHKFYTSSILQLSQHSHDLNEWRVQSKHEHDLHGLQKSSSTTTTLTSIPSDIPTSLTTSSPTTVVQTQEPVSVCRVYQFQCINSSDCIAIYNVCDGIPQCPDGSDEGAHLRCPPLENSKTNAPPVKSTFNPNEELPIIDATTSIPTKIPLTNLPASPPPEPLLPPKESWPSNRLPPIEAMPDWNNKPPTSLEQQQQQQQQQHPSGWSQASELHKLLPQAHSTAQQQAQVFTHKHSNFMAANNNPWASSEYYDPNYNSHYYPERPSYHPQQFFPRPEGEPIRLQEESHRFAPSQWSNTDKQVGGYSPGFKWTKEEEELYQPMVELPSTSPPTPSPAPDPPTTLSPQAKAMSLLASHHRNATSAVLALALGVCVTALFALLVGCRLHSLRYRVSRKRRSLAHDADYLVNGMYL